MTHIPSLDREEFPAHTVGKAEMNHTGSGPQRVTRNPVTWEAVSWDAVTAVLTTAPTLFLVSPPAALAAVAGLAITWLVRLQQHRQMRRAAEVAGNSPGGNLRYLYRCAAERFLATVALMSIAIIAMRLEVVPLLGGYLVGHLSMVVRLYREAGLRRRNGKRNDDSSRAG